MRRNYALINCDKGVILHNIETEKEAIEDATEWLEANPRSSVTVVKVLKTIVLKTIVRIEESE